MEYLIETKNLTKRFGAQKAVDDVSMHVRRGEIYGLIGKNGAGKTTLMRMLLGMSAPNSGEIRLFDSDKPNEARRGIGSLIEEPALYKNHTAFENLKRFAILVPTPDDELHELLKLVGLENTGRKKAGQFSLGMKQRLGIAIAMLGKPELLILDEPINGLDPAGIKEIRDLILRLNARGITFMISSHLLDELGKIATQFGIMANGSLVEEISSEKLAEKGGGYRECRDLGHSKGDGDGNEHDDKLAEIKLSGAVAARDDVFYRALVKILADNDRDGNAEHHRKVGRHQAEQPVGEPACS